MIKRFQNLLKPASRETEEERAACDTHDAEISIVAKRFSVGIAGVLDTEKRLRSLDAFARRQDPVYATLLEGMEDEDTVRALVENWMIGQTLATQSRFWLEDAIIDLLLHKCSSEPDVTKRSRVYSFHMLAGGSLQRGDSIWDLGEDWKSQVISRSGWKEFIGVATLRRIDAIVSEEEARYDQLDAAQRGRSDDEILGAVSDRAAIKQVVGSLGGAHRTTPLRCNMLVVNPEHPLGNGKILAVRYINPGTFTQGAIIREERVNLLRLSAFLAQEKLFRDPIHTQVVAADLVPRRGRGGSPARERSHFSTHTRWTADELWSDIGVPFAAVRAGIRRAGWDAGAILRGRAEEVRNRDARR